MIKIDLLKIKVKKITLFKNLTICEIKFSWGQFFFFKKTLDLTGLKRGIFLKSSICILLAHSFQ